MAVVDMKSRLIGSRKEGHLDPAVGDPGVPCAEGTGDLELPRLPRDPMCNSVFRLFMVYLAIPYPSASRGVFDYKSLYEGALSAFTLLWRVMERRLHMSERDRENRVLEMHDVCYLCRGEAYTR